MYAQVIVDVAAKQTDRAFDYIVPERLRDWIEVGSRVGVPFGARVIQGFVVGLCPESEIPDGKLREIKEALDLIPPLTEELIALAKWMSRTYLCREISALQSMIPGALKARYERMIEAGERSSAEVWNGLIPEMLDIVRFVSEKKRISLEQLLARFPDRGQTVKRLLEQGVLTEIHLIKDRLAKKTRLTVFPPADSAIAREAMERLPSKAGRQRDILQYLLDHPQPVGLAELTAKLHAYAGSVKALADKGWIELREVEVYRDPYADRDFPSTSPLPLTADQQAAFAPICSALRARRNDVFLLHGVTGSGKTEVYLQAIQECLNLEREAIVLVPEISLTPQIVERFKSRFGNRVAVLHSRLSQGERYDEWRKIQSGGVQIAIGARSAVFAPFRRLGLMIIDEEHESSYKQEESPKYHAREVAVERARHHRAVVLLGSATPSLESFYGAGGDGSRLQAEGRSGEESGRGPAIRLLAMPRRVAGRPLPEVEIVDMREQLKSGNRSMFSRPLYEAIQDRLAKREQMILLLNRRGHSTFVMCRSCGYVAQCPHCEIALTYHRHSRTLRCHYCGHAEREAAVCPECGSEHIRYFGTGTQRVEEELLKGFPGLRVIRMDVDTTNEKGAHEKLLNRFGSGQADVLLGTQMVAKGLDFPRVTLVGVIAADTVLNLPDFRAAEKTFQLLTQVAGRAGRDSLQGQVFIQTYNPDHYSILCAEKHDYPRFAARELEMRRKLGYPPYRQLILITLSHPQLTLLVKVAEQLAESIRRRFRAEFAFPDSMEDRPMEVYGPVASPIPRIKDRYRFQCMVKYRKDVQAERVVRLAIAGLDDLASKENLLISVDVNPQMMM